MADGIIPNGGGVPSDGAPEGHTEQMLNLAESKDAPAAVSYTHLTLPTKRIV